MAQFTLCWNDVNRTKGPQFYCCCGQNGSRRTKLLWKNRKPLTVCIIMTIIIGNNSRKRYLETDRAFRLIENHFSSLSSPISAWGPQKHPEANTFWRQNDYVSSHMMQNNNNNQWKQGRWWIARYSCSERLNRAFVLLLKFRFTFFRWPFPH